MRKTVILLSSFVVLFSLNGLAKEMIHPLSNITNQNIPVLRKTAAKALSYDNVYFFKDHYYKISEAHELVAFKGSVSVAHELSLGAAYLFPGKSHAARFSGEGFYPEGIVGNIVIDNPSAVFKDETNQRVFRIKNIRADVKLHYFIPAGQQQELFKISADKVYSAKLGNSVFYYIFKNSQNKLSAEFLDW